MPRSVTLIIAIASATMCTGASFRAPNFIVEAPTPELAAEIGQAAEQHRQDLAIEWLGEALPNWSRPCPIRAQVAPNLGAGGATSFVFDRGEVFNWDMQIQGSRERVLDSVLPHEITHTIFASHFRQPLPRWADEGACTTVEHESELSKQQTMLVSFLRTGKGIAFDKMFAMRDYPPDVLPLYAQGYALARFLIEQGGRRKFVDFVGDGLRTENWPAAVNSHYGYANLAVLQDEWLAWVTRGSPPLETDTQVAQTAFQRPAPCGSGDCMIQPPLVRIPQRTQAPQPPLATREQPAVPAGPSTSQLLVRLEKIERKLTEITTEPGPAGKDGRDGDPGPKGEKGDKGDPAQMDYDALAKAMASKLTHSATIKLLDGTTKTQTKPLNEPLEFVQHSLGAKKP